MNVAPWLPVVLLLSTAVAAFTDTRSGRIPNALTVPLVLLSPLIHWREGGAMGLCASLLGAAVCALPPLVLFRRGAMGGGDVKLLAGIGAGAGALAGLEVQVAAYVVAAVWASGVLLRKRALGRACSAAFVLLFAPWNAPRPTLGQSAETVRLGVPIFAAALGVLGPTVWGG